MIKKGILTRFMLESFRNELPIIMCLYIQYNILILVVMLPSDNIASWIKVLVKNI